MAAPYETARYSLQDGVPTPPGAMELDQLGRFLDDMRVQPNWRADADVEADFYDSNQYSPDIAAKLQARGLPPTPVNLIAPAINLVTGMEAKTRQDWSVVPFDGTKQNRLMAKALAVHLKEAEVQSDADEAIADAYGDQVKVGLGWVYVGRETDPFRYGYRVENVNRREIWWDMRARRRDLSDARYLVRRKWHDLDVLKAMFPQHVRLIEQAGTGTAMWDPTEFYLTFPHTKGSFLDRDWSLEEIEWRDTDRERLCLYEIWYRVYVSGLVMKFIDGRVVEFDQRNPFHRMSVIPGQNRPAAAQLVRAPYAKMRRAWWLGPFRLSDDLSPCPHNDFPYTPFWGYREDRTNVPYGLIRSMKPMQEEINARRAKMLWQLSAKTMIIEDDAVADHEKARRELSRPDAYLVLDSNRESLTKPGAWKGYEIHEHAGLTSQQMEAYQESKRDLERVTQISAPAQGRLPEDKPLPGVALAQLIEQSTTTLAKINSNMKWARQRVGHQVLAHLIEDNRDRELPTRVKDNGVTRVVVLNQRVQPKEPGQLAYRNNDIVMVRTRIELASIPDTPTYRSMLQLQITELIKALPEELQGVLLPLWINTFDLPNADQIAEEVRKKLGLGPPVDPEDMDENDQKVLEAWQQAQAEAEATQQRMQALAEEQLKADVDSERSEAELRRSKAGQMEADAALKAAQRTKTEAETAKIGAEIDQIDSGAADAQEGGGEGPKPRDSVDMGIGR